MAVHNKNYAGMEEVNSVETSLKDNQTQQQEQRQPYQAQQTQQTGFGLMPGITRRFSGSVGITGEVKTRLEELFAKENVKITEIDKDIFNTRYSSLVISKSNAKGEVGYFIVLFEGTSRPPLKASQLIEELKAMSMNPNSRLSGNAYLASDTVDGVLNDRVTGELYKLYGSNVRLINLDYLIIPHDSRVIAEEIADISYNTVNLYINKGSFKDAELSKQALAGKQINTHISQSDLTESGFRMARTDLKANIVVDQFNNRIQSPNASQETSEIATVGGFVEALPNTYMSQDNVPLTRLIPNIVIDYIKVTPTPSFALLSLIASTALTDKRNWLAGILPAGSRPDKGVLNLITDLFNEGNDVGPYEFNDPKLSTEDVVTVIGEMFPFNAVLSIDVENGSENHSLFAPFVTAASADASINERQNAVKEIIAAANNLTGGKFGDISLNDMFVSTSIELPSGHYYDKNGHKRPLADIDLAFVTANSNGNINIVREFAETLLPKEFTSINPFTKRVEIISQYYPDAVISGKTNRITLSNKFLQQLMNAVVQCGFAPQMNTLVNIHERLNFNKFSVYGNAGLGNTNNVFATQGNATSTLNMPYGHQMMGRFN